MIVKARDNTDAFIYVPEDMADTDLHGPINPANNQPCTIKPHRVLLRLRGLPTATATKTATGSYDRTITWTLDKSVIPGSHSGTAGQTAGSSTWTVVATENVTLGNYEVTGSIMVNNTNSKPRYKTGLCYLACTVAVGTLLLIFDLRLYHRAATVRCLNRRCRSARPFHFSAKSV